MPKQISKTYVVTKVSYSLVAITDNVPEFVPQEDVVFSGELSPERVRKLLGDKHGKDTTIVVTKMNVGRHRFVMDWRDFVKYAVIDDAEGAGAQSDDEETDANETDIDSDDDSSNAPDANETDFLNNMIDNWDIDVPF